MTITYKYKKISPEEAYEALKVNGNEPIDGFAFRNCIGDKWEHGLCLAKVDLDKNNVKPFETIFKLWHPIWKYCARIIEVDNNEDEETYEYNVPVVYKASSDGVWPEKGGDYFVMHWDYNLNEWKKIEPFFIDYGDYWFYLPESPENL